MAERTPQDYFDNLTDPYVDETGKTCVGGKEALCDFCCWPLGSESWTYPTGFMELPMHGVVDVTDDDWGACLECHALIQSDNTELLIDRIILTQLDGHGLDSVPAVARNDVRRKLREHLARWQAARKDEPPYHETLIDSEWVRDE